MFITNSIYIYNTTTTTEKKIQLVLNLKNIKGCLKMRNLFFTTSKKKVYFKGERRNDFINATLKKEEKKYKYKTPKLTYTQKNKKKI